MYLWKLLHVEINELIFRIYRSQKSKSHSGDWVRLLDNDRKLLGLELSDEEIESLSKNKFKKFIQKKIENFALFELNELKLKHKKSQIFPVFLF